MTLSKILSIMMLLRGLYVAMSSTMRKQYLCTCSLFWSLCKKHCGDRLMKMFVSTTHYLHSHSLSQACLFDGVKTVTRNSLLHIVSLWQQKVFLPPHIFSYSYHRVLFFFLLFLSRHLYSAILPEDVAHDKKCCKKN